jgi:hypothetical protein
MNRPRIGILWQLVGALLFIAGLIPGAVLFNPWRTITTQEQWEVTYFTANGISAALVAIVGLAVGYILFRLGSQLKPKRKRDSDTDFKS